jgi:hypothetical protein
MCRFTAGCPTAQIIRQPKRLFVELQSHSAGKGAKGSVALTNAAREAREQMTMSISKDIFKVAAVRRTI